MYLVSYSLLRKQEKTLKNIDYSTFVTLLEEKKVKQLIMKRDFEKFLTARSSVDSFTVETLD